MTERQAAAFDAAADSRDQQAELLREVSDAQLATAYYAAVAAEDSGNATRYANEAVRRGLIL